MGTQYSTKPLESLMAENLGHSRDFSTFIVNKIMKHRDKLEDLCVLSKFDDDTGL